ncbi:hypothetical protein Avbf_16495 [Armadillidium vulgare]|nr:hypothetical protein Avbf_16495 [Armadillidium vulgare]
MEKGQRARSL